MSKKNANKKVVINEQQREKQELLAMKKLDPTNLKEEIYQLRQQMNYLINQKVSLETEMIKGNQRYMKDSFEIEKTIKIQEEELVDLENNYKLLKNTFEENRKKSRIQWDNQVQQLQKKKNQEKEIYVKNLTNLTKKIEYLKQFKNRQIQYQKTLVQLKEKEQANKVNHQKDIDKIKWQHEAKRNELKEATAKQIENIKQLQVNKLEQKMNREQQIKKQNQIILEEIALCESQKKILEQEYNQLIGENLANKNNQIGEILEGQASQTYERSLRVIKLENKLVKLKEYLQQEMARLNNELKDVDKKFDEAELQLQKKIEKVTTWLKLKQKDLKKMKACSQMVLNQRSSLEAYLLEVFHEHAELDHKDPSNINQILRFLFIKINSKKPPISYKDYLLSTEHSQVSKKSVIQ